MSSKPSNKLWMTGAIVIVAAVLFVLRCSTSIQSNGPVLDQQYITVPINNLIDDGWSIETAIDFQETKGPAMIWPYAVVGKWFGGTTTTFAQVEGFRGHQTAKSLSSGAVRSNRPAVWTTSCCP